MAMLASFCRAQTKNSVTHVPTGGMRNVAGRDGDVRIRSSHLAVWRPWERLGHASCGWWFGTCFIFHNIWDVILRIDEIIFSQRGSNHQPAAGSDELNLRPDTSGAKLPNLAELRVRIPGTLAQCHGTKAQVAPGDAMVTPEVDVVWPRVVITAKNGPTTG